MKIARVEAGVTREIDLNGPELSHVTERGAGGDKLVMRPGHPQRRH